ncbi:MAG: SDR family oxidoreductase [Mangrovibacterium sp.]
MREMINILLTGGTGQLGRVLLNEFDTQKLSVSVLTRGKALASSSGIKVINADLTDPASLNSTLRRNYDVVIHCASNPHESDTVDVKGTENLLKAVGKGNVKNFVYISIVGVDKCTYRYYQDKRRAEELVNRAGVPYTILRITQFHDFVLNRILNVGEGDDVITVPAGLKFQSIDLSDVSKKINQLLQGGPCNSILQIGGPEILETDYIVQEYQTIVKPTKKIQFTSNLNDFQKLFTTGINLCPDKKWGTVSWGDYLTSLSLTQPSAKEYR